MLLDVVRQVLHAEFHLAERPDGRRPVDEVLRAHLHGAAQRVALYHPVGRGLAEGAVNALEDLTGDAVLSTDISRARLAARRFS